MAYIGNQPFGKTVRTTTSETLTSVKTAFYPTGGYTTGFVDVFLNGARLAEVLDFTATDGTLVTLLFNPEIGDTVDIITYGSVELANAVRRSGDTMTGNLVVNANTTIAGNLVVSGDTTISGSGASLTSLNGTNISSGTVARARLPAGSILQVVNTYYITPTSQSVTSNTITPITGLEAVITPTSTSSRILIFVRWFGEHGTDGSQWDTMFGITRDGTAIGLPATNGSSTLGIHMTALSYYAANADSTPETTFYNYVDSPSTTSAVTYRAYIVGAGETLYTNRCVNTSTASAYERGTSSIILMEIAG
jgi:hypothetical protein